MSTSLFSQTPMVTVRDNRDRPIREIAFHRHPDAPAMTDTRITYHRHDARGFLTQSTDPRLHEAGLANFTYLTSLAGEVLRTQSVDAGTSLALSDVAGRPCLTLHNISADQPDPPVTRTWQYEAASLSARPLCVTEQVAGAPARIIERFVWADPTPEAQAHNLAGQCIRHYDTAGLEHTHSVALSGVPLSVARQLLKDADNPDTVVDWQDQGDAGLEPDAYTTQTTPDATGAVLSTEDAAGHRQRLSYDVAGQFAGSWLILKGGTEQVIVKSLSYSAAGQKLREEHGNGVVTTYTYEPKTQRLASIKTERQGSGAKVLQDLRYAYDPVGNVVSVRNDAEATRFWRNQKVVPENTYAYDSLYQLVSATGREMADARRQGQGRAHPALIAFDDATYTSYTRTYTYDTADNLSQIRHSAPASGNSYTTDITVSARSNRAVLSTLAKDPTEVEALFHAGGQQRLLLPGQSLAWTPRGELDQVTPITRERGADDHERYRYDSASQRVLKSSIQQASGSTQKHQVLYLPGLELRRTASGDKVAEDLQVITVGEAGRAQVRVLHWLAGKPTDITNDQLRYSYDDQTGSGALEVDGTGELISQEEYYPYGGTALWAARNAMEARYKTVRYSGKERDATGLYYYGYRYYQPWVGRWLSADPAGTVDGLNVYCMVRGNPTSSVDEQGTMKKAFSSLLPPNKKAQFKTRMDEALATMKEAPVPKTIHMIWIGTRPISEKNKALSIETAQRNPDYTTRVLYDSGIAGHEAARDDLKRQFEDSGVEVSNVRDLPYFSQISAHPAFRFYEKVVNEGNYAQASDLLRLLVLLHEGGIYKDIDDTQQEPFGDLSLPAGLGFKQEYAASQGKASAVPNTPIAAAEGHAVIKKTLALAVDNYERGETDVLKLAGPDVFTQALYQELPLATNNIGTQWDNIKQGIYKNRKEVLTSEQFLLLREPREKMLAFGKKVFNGADHSWQKK